MDVLGNLDFLGRGKLIRPALAAASFPSDPAIGELIFKDKQLYVYVEAAVGLPFWVPITHEIETYKHVQETAALEWTVNHALGTEDVSVVVYDEAGGVIAATVTVTNADSILLTFANPEDGFATVFAQPQGGGAPAEPQVDPEGWELIENIAWSTSLNSLDIALPWTTYRKIRMVGHYTRHGPSETPYMLLSSNGGSSFDTGANYGWGRYIMRSGGANMASNSTGDTKYPFAEVDLAFLTAADTGADFEFTFVEANKTSEVSGDRVTTLITGDVMQRVNASGATSERRMSFCRHKGEIRTTHARFVLAPAGTGPAGSGSARVVGVRR